ncbi:MAG: asparagine synthase (glutamine-hydrolyzing) [Flavobacteriaceae bacterium]|nr:asparagine synthase (glutamine-hydrolyzing) [Flavobacteriaceae bacterium]
MCGIAGIINNSDTIDVTSVIKNMTSVIPHRGPDGEGHFINKNKLGLGHKRLSIIDVSENANQPFYSNCENYVIILNGEVYNYKEIKSQIDDYNFKTQSDTEVLLAAYIKWGPDCLQKVNGMFSIAIYDIKNTSLFIARDRMGIKPLYYYKSDDVFLFASEIKQILASKLVTPEIDRQGLVQYFKNKTVYAPNTILKDIKTLEAGSFISYKEGELSFKKYWDVLDAYDSQFSNKSYDTIKKDINELLLESVRLRMISDVPLGAFLSGGIDSSILVGLASKISKVNTIAITFDEDKYDESTYSRLIAKKFNTDHLEVNFKGDQLLEYLPSIMKSMDHPTLDGVNTHFISQKAKESGLTVSLSGLGGDELFAGYNYFKWGYNYKKYLEKLPTLGGPVKSILGKSIVGVKENVITNKAYEYFNSSKKFEDKYHIFRQLYFSNQLNGLFSFDPVSYQYNVPDKSKISKFPSLSQFSYMELTTYMENVLLRDTDQMSMASSIEVRVPFLDHNLVEYVMNVDDKYKYPTYPKKLLIESVGDLIPEEIYNRKKMGFTFPWEHWLRNELKDFTEKKIESLAARKEFNSDFIINTWKDFLNRKKSISFSRIWVLVSLESTLQNYGL